LGHAFGFRSPSLAKTKAPMNAMLTPTVREHWLLYETPSPYDAHRSGGVRCFQVTAVVPTE
jgi:hypothetical protein